MATYYTNADWGWTDGTDVTTDFVNNRLPVLISGDIVIFEGLYQLATDVTWPTNITLQATEVGRGIQLNDWINSGASNTLTFQEGTTLQGMTFYFEDQGSDPISNNGTPLEMSGDNLTVDNCLFAGENGGSSRTKELLRVSSGSNFVCRDTTFIGSFYQCYVLAYTDLLWEGCLFDSTTGDGIKTVRAASQVGVVRPIVRGCVFLNGSRDGIDTTGGWEDALVENSYFVGSGVAGLDIKTSFQDPLDGGVEENKNILIQNNEFIDCNDVLVNTLNDNNVPPIVSDANFHQWSIRDVTLKNNIFEQISTSDVRTLLDKGSARTSFEDNTHIGNIETARLNVTGNGVDHITINTTLDYSETGVIIGTPRSAQPDSYYRGLAGQDFGIEGGPTSGTLNVDLDPTKETSLSMFWDDVEEYTGLNVSSTKAGTVYYCWYAAGSTPSDEDIVNGTDKLAGTTHGNFGTLVAPGEITDPTPDYTGVPSGPLVELHSVQDIDDGGSYTNTVLVQYEQEAVAGSIYSIVDPIYTDTSLPASTPYVTGSYNTLTTDVAAINILHFYDGAGGNVNHNSGLSFAGQAIGNQSLRHVGGAGINRATGDLLAGTTSGVISSTPSQTADDVALTAYMSPDYIYSSENDLTSSSGTALTVTVDVPEGGAVIAHWLIKDEAGVDVTLSGDMTGITPDIQFDNSGNRCGVAVASELSANAAYVVTINRPLATANRWMLAVTVLAPRDPGWTELINDDFTGYTLNDTIESNANWTAFSVIGSGRSVVSPVGTGVVDQNGTGTANNNWQAYYQGATGNDQAIEVQVSSVTNDNRRNDPTIFVRSDGTNNNRNCVRAFWRVSTDDIFFDEYDGAGAIGGQSQTISQAFTDGDILRLEVEGTTAKLFHNGSQIGSDMTGVTVASGTAAFGAYCQANPAGVNYAYVKVEDK